MESGTWEKVLENGMGWKSCEVDIEFPLMEDFLSIVSTALQKSF